MDPSPRAPADEPSSASAACYRGGFQLIRLYV